MSVASTSGSRPRASASETVELSLLKKNTRLSQNESRPSTKGTHYFTPPSTPSTVTPVAWHDAETDLAIVGQQPSRRSVWTLTSDGYAWVHPQECPQSSGGGPHVDRGAISWMVLCASVALTFVCLLVFALLVSLLNASIFQLCQCRSFCIGLMNSWGLLQHKMVQLGICSEPFAALIGSTAIAMIGPITLCGPHLIFVVGSRNLALLGSLIYSGSLFASAWISNSASSMFLLVGVVSGLGMAMIVVVTGILPSHHFNKRRGTVEKVSFAANGIIGALWPFFLYKMERFLEFSWIFTLLGLMAFMVTTSGSLFMRPRHQQLKSLRYFDNALLFDGKYCLLFVGGFFGSFSHLCLPMLAPLYTTALRQPPIMAAVSLAVYSVSSGTGRVLLSILGASVGMEASVSFASFLVTSSIFFLWQVSVNVWVYLVCMAVNGFGSGGFYSGLPPLVLGTFAGEGDLVPHGMTSASWSIGHMAGVPLAAAILEHARAGDEYSVEHFHGVIYFCGTASLICTTCLLSYRCIMRPEIVEEEPRS